MACCSTSRAKRALERRLFSTLFCALRTRLSAPIGSILRRISLSIAQVGVAKAFSLRNFTASAWRAFGIGREAHAVLTNVFLLGVEPADDRGHVVQLQRPLAEHAAVQLSRDPSYGSPFSVVVAGSSILATRCRFLMPSVVLFTASASPTASVSSPGSLPAAPAVENRYHGVSSCSRAHCRASPSPRPESARR